MNKSVYLFELDSVRKTDEEVRIGQRAFYDELFGNGNTVILSMNQITDSRAVLCMLHNQETYEILKKYFENGLVRISRYGRFRTTSQYLQNSIRKNLFGNNEDIFIYSALPVKTNQKRLLLLMREVLVNADLSAIKDYIDGSLCDKRIGLFKEYDKISDDRDLEKNEVNEEDAKKKLQILYRFLELVLLISMYDEASTPAIDFSKDSDKERNFLDFMNVILHFQDPKDDSNLWEKSRGVLQSILDEATLEKKNCQDRSVWIKKLNKRKNENENQILALEYAELIVNLCYNYTVEYSIYGASKHYRRESLYNNWGEATFQDDFFSHLSHDWQDGEDADHRFLQEESDNFKLYTGECPEWKQINRVIQRRIIGKRKKKKKQSDKIPLYEYDYSKERRKTKGKDILNIVKVILVTFVYIGIMIGMDRLLSKFENFLGEVIKSSVTFLVIIFASALINKIFPIPDMIDCAKMFFTTALDIIRIARHKESAYSNKKNEHNATMENLPRLNAQDINLNDQLEEYRKLANDRPKLFADSDNLHIVDPRKSEGVKTILAYQVDHDVTIGINYKSKYHMLLVDLVYGADSKLFTYERLIPIVEQGAVVIIPMYQNNYVLLEQFRHAMRESQIAFPRGYGEFELDDKCLSSQKNACKEVSEELGITQDQIEKQEYLGQVIADSGVSGNKVSVYQVSVKEYREKIGYEGIESVRLMTEDEVEDAISNGKINDGFTLAAWSMRNKLFWNKIIYY